MDGCLHPPSPAHLSKKRQNANAITLRVQVNERSSDRCESFSCDSDRSSEVAVTLQSQNRSDTFLLHIKSQRNKLLCYIFTVTVLTQNLL